MIDTGKWKKWVDTSLRSIMDRVELANSTHIDLSKIGTGTSSQAIIGGETPSWGNPWTSLGYLTSLSGSILSDGSVVGATSQNQTFTNNIVAPNLLEGYTKIVTSATPVTLISTSNNMQYFTGSTNQTVVMPVTSTLILGQSYWIVNLSSAIITVNSSGGDTIVILPAGTCAEITCILTSGTTTASWNAQYFGTVNASGKKLTVNNSLTFTGTDGTSFAFPSSSKTLAASDGSNITALASTTAATTQTQSTNSTTIATTAWARLYTQPMFATPTALTPGSVVTWTPVLGVDQYTITPASAETINMGTIPSSMVGATVVLRITTSGTSSYAITFGTNIKSQGVLNTGSVTAMTFHVTFKIVSTTSVIEMCRTIAM